MPKNTSTSASSAALRLHASLRGWIWQTHGRSTGVRSPPPMPAALTETDPLLSLCCGVVWDFQKNFTQHLPVPF